MVRRATLEIAHIAHESTDAAAAPDLPRVRLAHVMTVPESFALLDGQAAQMRAWGIGVIGFSAPGARQALFAEREGATVVGIPMRRQITPWRDLLTIARLILEFRKFRPLIVHAHTPKGGLLGMIAATIARVPVRIYHMRGLPMMTATGARYHLLVLTERLSCGLAHRVLCVSDSLRHFAVAQRLVGSDKIVTMLGGTGNGVDALGRFDPDRPLGDRDRRRKTQRELLNIPSSATVVAFLGRIVRDKGVVELADAWIALSGRYRDAHLIVAGPLEQEDPVPAATLDALRAHPAVHIIEGLTDARDVYAAADIVVLPTHREGMPNVPLEAASMRLPVVATRIPGCVDAVAHNETGILVPPGSSPALAAALELYLVDERLRRRHGHAGRERMLLNFRREAIWAATYEQYRDLLRRRGMDVLPLIPVAREKPHEPVDL